MHMHIYAHTRAHKTQARTQSHIHTGRPGSRLRNASVAGFSQMASRNAPSSLHSSAGTKSKVGVLAQNNAGERAQLAEFAR